MAVGTDGLASPRLAPLLLTHPLQELVWNFADRPRDFMPLHIAHFHSICRLVLSSAGLLDRLRAAAYDAVVSDSTFQCGFVLANLLGVRRIDLSPVSARIRPQLVPSGVWAALPCLCQAVCCLRCPRRHPRPLLLPLLRPWPGLQTHLVDPFWSRYHGLHYSPALHPFIGSGLAHPMVRAGAGTWTWVL